jgi:FMN phosphatase YigB (HAD superfamily)
MIGDREADLIAGKSAGCKTVHINQKNNENSFYSDYEFCDLSHSVEFISKYENMGLFV